jgi:hypothetical protein
VNLQPGGFAEGKSSISRHGERKVIVGNGVAPASAALRETIRAIPVIASASKAIHGAASPKSLLTKTSVSSPRTRRERRDPYSVSVVGETLFNDFAQQLRPVVMGPRVRGDDG